MKYFSPLLKLFCLRLLLPSAGAQDIKDCSDSDCILMMIGDKFSPLNTDQCKLHAPRLLNFGGSHFCGAFLDDTTGVVVTKTCVPSVASARIPVRTRFTPRPSWMSARR